MRHVAISFCAIGIAFTQIARTAEEPVAVRPPKSPEAVKAEAEYKEAIVNADRQFTASIRDAQRELTKSLEKAKDMATKNGDLDEAVALKARLAQVAESSLPPPAKTLLGRDKLARELADVTWFGSPNWGRFVLKADGSVTFEKPINKTSQWGAVTEDILCITDREGHVTIMILDKDRRTLHAHTPMGVIGKPDWKATRAKPKQ